MSLDDLRAALAALPDRHRFMVDLARMRDARAAAGDHPTAGLHNALAAVLADIEADEQRQRRADDAVLCLLEFTPAAADTDTES